MGLLTRLAVIPLLVMTAVALTTTKWPMLVAQGLWHMAHEARTDWSMSSGSLLSRSPTLSAPLGTATAIGLFVDGARMPVHVATQFDEMMTLWAWIALATIGVVIGTLPGSRVLRRIPEVWFRRTHLTVPRADVPRLRIWPETIPFGRIPGRSENEFEERVTRVEAVADRRAPR